MKNVLTAVKLFLVLSVVTGLVYPLVVWGGARLFFRGKAEGSIVARAGRPVGSELVGQAFAAPGYFHPRPSATGYGTMPSGGSNLSPASAALRAAEARRAAACDGDTPDMLYASASGLDPDISPEAALFQASRVARARGASKVDIISLVKAFTEPRQFGFLGEPRVNVLLLNLELDREYPYAGK